MGRSQDNKDELFAQEYCKDFSPSAAYLRLHPNVTAKTAKEAANKLLNKPIVIAAIDRIKSENKARHQVDEDLVIEELKRIAFSNMRDFADWTSGKVTFKGSEEMPKDYAVVISEISQTETLRGSQIKLKLHDKIKALEMLGKKLGLFNTKVEVKDENDKVKSIIINL